MNRRDAMNRVSTMPICRILFSKWYNFCLLAEIGEVPHRMADGEFRRIC
jgi:hypothetical protein